jgi:hypothetical protein
MVLEQSQGFDPANPRAYLALQGRILHRIQDWLRSRDLPAHFLWVREVAPRYGHQHTHVLMPLPPELKEELAELIHRVGGLYDTPNNRAVVVEANRLHGNKGIWTPASRAGVMRDLLKTMSSRARVNGKQVMPALEVRNKGQRPGTVLGKRSGTSVNIGVAARAAAGWRELEKLDELRAVLPTGKDAQKERRREKRQRHRVGRASHGMSPWKLPRPIAPEDEEDGLDADFFD